MSRIDMRSGLHCIGSKTHPEADSFKCSRSNGAYCVANSGCRELAPCGRTALPWTIRYWCRQHGTAVVSWYDPTLVRYVTSRLVDVSRMPPTSETLWSYANDCVCLFVCFLVRRLTQTAIERICMKFFHVDNPCRLDELINFRAWKNILKCWIALGTTCAW